MIATAMLEILCNEIAHCKAKEMKEREKVEKKRTENNLKLISKKVIRKCEQNKRK